jgi:anaerobic selenocysteine-containing dehydrogenase
MLTTVRSHDQFNTTIYSNDDRYRGLKGLCTVILMNENDMRGRGLDEFDLVDIASIAKDGSRRIRPLRHPVRMRRRVHARAERPLRDR